MQFRFDALDVWYRACVSDWEEIYKGNAVTFTKKLAGIAGVANIPEIQAQSRIY